MVILPLDKRLVRYLKRHGIEKQFEKQKALFETNPLHPSLHTELMEPKQFRVYSFRITRSYRALFFYVGSEAIEITDVNNHYR